MSPRKKERGKNFKYLMLTILSVIVLGAAVWLVIVKFEGGARLIELKMEDPYIGAEEQISALVRDEKSGIRRLRVAVIQNGKETVLMEQAYEKGKAAQGEGKKSFTININTRRLGLSDGRVDLRATARDDSWRNWFSGNRGYIEKELVVDTVSPEIEVLTRQHNVSQGGAGLIIYRVSEKCQKQGVSANGNFFPGYSGYFDDPDVYIAFFGLAHNQKTDAEMQVKAVDRAGNTGRSGFYYHLKNKNFDAETLRISDGLLSRILPGFENVDGFPKGASRLKQFLFVNKDLRQKNNKALLASEEKGDARMHWSGAFMRLPNSARQAGFADHRTYVYKGEVIDKEVHLGIDLASVRQAPVPAANTGRVAFVGRVGIYGNVVIVDHGFGLFSVYAHLSRSSVNEGQMVEKSDLLGYTGSTGLAVGDHLHYGMFIHDIFVNPVEWWDAAWIKNNVTAKLEHVKSRLNNR
ncbi:MAG: M23 family metallopeptidase [Desulfobacteraceae bacterium]|nr:M23 family metallopeptidase [Desulfobacteraceae bacterium]